jgi:hypothetical protein
VVLYVKGIQGQEDGSEIWTVCIVHETPGFCSMFLLFILKLLTYFYNVRDFPQNVNFSRIFSPIERPGLFPKIEKKALS